MKSRRRLTTTRQSWTELNRAEQSWAVWKICGCRCRSGVCVRLPSTGTLSECVRALLLSAASFFLSFFLSVRSERERERERRRRGTRGGTRKADGSSSNWRLQTANSIQRPTLEFGSIRPTTTTTTAEREDPRRSAGLRVRLRVSHESLR